MNFPFSQTFLIMDSGSQQKLNIIFLLGWTLTPDPPTNHHNAIGVQTNLCMSTAPKSQSIVSTKDEKNSEGCGSLR